MNLKKLIQSILLNNTDIGIDIFIYIYKILIFSIIPKVSYTQVQLSDALRIL